MKRLLNNALPAALIAGVLLLIGCDKGGKENGGVDNSFSGVYNMAAAPLYSDMSAANPAGTAVQLEGVNMTYAQLILAAYTYLPTVKVEDNPLEVTFNADGTMKVVEKDPVGGDDTLFPDPADGLPANGLTYALSGKDLVFSLSSDFIDALIDGEEEDPAYSAQIKAILAKLDKGIFVYSASDNTAKVNLRYTLSGKNLSLYADKSLVTDTWSAAKPVAAEIAALIGKDKPDIAAIITALVPQIDAMLGEDGFTKIEVGVRLTKK